MKAFPHGMNVKEVKRSFTVWNKG